MSDVMIEINMKSISESKKFSLISFKFPAEIAWMFDCIEKCAVISSNTIKNSNLAVYLKLLKRMPQPITW